MGVLATVAGAELAVEPERVQVVVVRVDGGLRRVADVGEGLVAADRDRAVGASKADEVGRQHVDLLGHLALLSLAEYRDHAPRQTNSRPSQSAAAVERDRSISCITMPCTIWHDKPAT
jgi:hypothetical protein